MTRKGILYRIALMSIFTGLFSCVTINIYFPAEEVKRAAEEIVRDIRQTPETRNETAPPSKSPQSEGFLRRSFTVLIETPQAHAQPETTVSNAAIRELKDRMRSRQAGLAPFFSQGAIGENNQGYVDLRDAGSLDVKSRAQVQRLMNAENQDRKQLYGEVARALNVDAGQIGRIGTIFANEWQKTASPGWPIQQPDGRWVKK